MLTINLAEILVDPQYRLDMPDFKEGAQTETQFMVMLAPVVRYVFLHFNHLVQHEYPQLQSLADADLLMTLLKRELVSLLNPMLVRVCVAEMHVLKQQQQLQGDTPQARFDYFIRLLEDSANALYFFRKYPVLQSVLETAVSQFIQAYQELLVRLAADYEELCREFLENDIHYRLKDITTGGDKHRQGRSVMILAFANGLQSKKVVYKPRSLKVDVAFQYYVRWFNRRSEAAQLFEQNILAKESYGWCEFVSYLPCENLNDVRNFYERMGMWLALVYALGGSDLHAENIIAHGTHPVIVDFECSLKPFLLIDEKDDRALPRYLVSETHFLPGRIMAGKGAKGFDISALGSEGGEEIVYQLLKWENAGTDEMRALRAPVKTGAHFNKPKWGEQSVSVLDYAQDFILGFENAYRVILRHLPELFQAQSPLEYFASAEIRVLFRNTAEYGKLLYESYHPKLLMNVEARNAHFAWLNNVAKEYPFYARLFAAELADLQEGNIPAFYCQAQESSLVDGRYCPLSVTVLETALDCAKKHLKHHFSENDLLIQKTLILNSFEALKFNNGIERAAAQPWKLPAANQVNFLEVQANALRLARRELDRLDALKIVNRERVFWPNIEVVNELTRNAGFTDVHLYNGVAGIALTFAYAGRVLQEPRYEETARLCLNSLRKTIALRGAKCYQSAGAYSGMGGHIYLFARLYDLWRDESLKHDLVYLLSLLPDLIKQDRCFDVISGVSGGLAAVLSAKNSVDSSLIKAGAAACVEHLLTGYPQPEKLLSTTESANTKPLLGFSHGVLGCAWALAKYHGGYPSLPVQNWIEAALNYARAGFSPAEKNWPDFRKSTQPDVEGAKQSPVAWCHGAPGAGVALLEMRKQLPDERIDREISMALEKTFADGFSDYQGLCHGNLGNLDFILLALQEWPDTALREQYQCQVAAVLNGIEKFGARCERVHMLATPGLMTGTAGVVYQLLRVARPDLVPSVLALAAS